MMSRLGKWSLVIISASTILLLSVPALALDGYQDRRGFFGGIGFGGGGVFAGSEPGGGIVFDFQLGGGATQNLTVALDTDLSIHILEHSRNLLLTPGPEVNYFFGETGIFARVGIGMALTFSWFEDTDFEIPAGGKKPDDTDFRLGFDGSLGVGWEFFVNSDLALGLAFEGDYVVLNGDDIASFGFSFGLKHY